LSGALPGGVAGAVWSGAEPRRRGESLSDWAESEETARQTRAKTERARRAVAFMRNRIYRGRESGRRVQGQAQGPEREPRNFAGIPVG